VGVLLSGFVARDVSDELAHLGIVADLSNLKVFGVSIRDSRVDDVVQEVVKCMTGNAAVCGGQFITRERVEV
jgi:hypothetical protein